MKIAALQMVSGTDVPGNLRSARSLLEQAAAQGAELAVLPEYFCILGRRDTDKLQVQEAFGQGPIQSFLAQAARELGLWIAAGTLPLSTPDQTRMRNSLLVFNPQGACAARYDKMHLFRFDNGGELYDETRVLEAGTQPVCFDLPSRSDGVFRIGLSICYDLRFPELYRHYASQGAHVLLVPSAFTHTTGQAHWDVLLRARAIENLAYVIAPAQGGLHENGRRTWGHSLVVNPWGELLAQQAEGEGVVMSDISLASLQQYRSQLPALAHRNPKACAL